MPLEERINYLSTCSYKNKLNFLLASTCAPVIKGLSCANTLTVKYGSYKHINSELSNTSISVKCLFNDSFKEVLLIYRKDILKEYLSKNRNYLKEFGYDKVELNYCLNRLSNKFSDFYLTNNDFPHELGIFLNYPVDDIKGFIANEGKNSLMCKYWKVYSNLNKAKDTFKKIDEAIEICLKQIVDGYNLCDIVA